MRAVTCCSGISISTSFRAWAAPYVEIEPSGRREWRFRTWDDLLSCGGASAAHQLGGQVDEQREEHEDGRNAEGHVNSARSLGVDVRGPR